MRIKITKTVKYEDSEGALRYELEKGSVHDFGISEAFQFCDEGNAKPADDEAEVFLKTWRNLSEEQRDAVRSAGFNLTVTDAANAADSVP
jgi:hypothetical protein